MSGRHQANRSQPYEAALAWAIAALVAAGALAASAADQRAASAPNAQPAQVESAILVYHRFGPSVADSMTVRTDTFRGQLDYLSGHGYPIVPLRSVVAYHLGQGDPPPSRAVVITVDDGHRSVFTDMLPIVQERQVPVTLFIYPSAISNASYALTWPELEALHRTGLFDIQSHTYWHPNFRTERQRLSPDAFQALAATQLAKSRMILRQRLGVDAQFVAWPFGIYDDELIGMAREAGYIAGFTLDRRLATPRDRVMALPRLLVTDAATGRAFAGMLPEAHR